jgi:hypothetical protein
LGEACTDALTITQARDKVCIALGLVKKGYTQNQIKTRSSGPRSRAQQRALIRSTATKYLTERRHKLGKRTREDYQRLIDTYLADWKQRPVEVVNDDDEVIKKFTAITSPSQANYSFKVVRLLLITLAASATTKANRCDHQCGGRPVPAPAVARPKAQPEGDQVGGLETVVGGGPAVGG